jgi:hypothetical protein
MKHTSHHKNRPDEKPIVDLARFQFFEEQRGNGGVLNNHFFGDHHRSVGESNVEKPMSSGPDGTADSNAPDPLPE